MGSQIAIQAACYGYTVKSYDTDAKMFGKNVAKLTGLAKTSGRSPTRPVDEWLKAADKVAECKDLTEALENVDLVIEACPENLELKRKVFAEIDSLAPAEAVLGTNSSAIPISQIESSTRRPDKCLNLHFYSLVRGTNMVDIMGGTRTSAETVDLAREWVRSIGCVPLLTKKEISGFGFNRVWRSVKSECLFLWANGYVDFVDIDRAWMIMYKTDRGPFGQMDGIGLDVIYDVSMFYYNESKESNDYPPQALKEMVERGELGVKTGKGFYEYPNPKYTKPNFLTDDA